MISNLKKMIQALCIIGMMVFVSNCNSRSNSPNVNEPAPNFSLTDSNGESVELYNFKGRPIILEWTNHLCPFVEKHYNANNMQSLQNKYAEQGVTWLTIISSAQGKQGYVTGEQANELTSSRNAAPKHVLLDPEGKVGRLYGAETTPHMYIIDRSGKLVYKGAIDSVRSTDVADIEKAVNYVDQVMDELEAGKPVSVQETKAYGCSVKY